MTDPPIFFDNWRTKPRYAIYQYELSPSGTPHLQGYIVFNHSRRVSAINNDLGNVAWIHRRNGTHSQAKAYCQKEDTRLDGPWTYGTDEGIPETQGMRSDLAAVKRKLDDRVKMSEIAENHFVDFIKHNKGIREYKRVKALPRSWEMEVIVLFGPTATGKTKYAYDKHGDDLYSVPQAKGSGTYWDDYDGQETVLVDEMYGTRFNHGFLLQLIDRYALCVPVHGGSVNFSSKRIIFTSNSHPDQWYSSMYEKTGTVFFMGALHRRLVQGSSCIIHCQRDQQGFHQSFRTDDDYKFPTLL